jgi:hypothetical protein
MVKERKVSLFTLSTTSWLFLSYRPFHEGYEVEINPAGPLHSIIPSLAGFSHTQHETPPVCSLRDSRSPYHSNGAELWSE